MQVIPLEWSRSASAINELGRCSESKAVIISYGAASFAEGARHPEEGFSTHDGIEVSFILEGEFEIETPAGTVSVAADSLVIIPAGEAHATRTIAYGRVAYVLLTEKSE